MPNCQYIAPTTISEVCTLLGQHGARARLVAGGQTVALDLRAHRARPNWLVALHLIPGLDAIEQVADGLRIGALVTHEQLKMSALVRGQATALAQAAESITDKQVRTTGTLGGALAARYAACDPEAALVALGASVIIESLSGTRTAAVEGLALGADEVLTHVTIPTAVPGTVSVFEKFTFREGDFAVVAVAIAVRRDPEGTITAARVTTANVATSPVRIPALEAQLAGMPLTEAVIDEAGRIASAQVTPFGEPMASSEFKQHLVGVLVRNALRRMNGGEGQQP